MSKRGGFTLIEITLVLAITGALLAIVFAGQSTLRSSFQFGSTIEKTTSTLNSIHSESLTTVNSTGTGNGGAGDSGGVQVVGEEVRIQANSSTIKVGTLKYNGSTITYTLKDTLTVPYGVKYAGSSVARIYYARTPQTGELLTFIDTPANGFQGTDTDPTKYIKFSNANKTVGKYLYSDSAGNRFACISIDPQSGTATAQIDIDSTARSNCHN